MIAVVERDDRRAAGREPGHLDGVLHRLGAGIEQRGTLLVRARREPRELLTDLHVALVRGDHEAGVGETADLLAHFGDDALGGVPDAHDGDSRAEVDERIAVDVDQHPAAGPLDEHRQRGAHTARDGGIAARHQLRRARAWDGGDNSSFLGQLGACRNRVAHIAHADKCAGLNDRLGIGLDSAQRR